MVWTKLEKPTRAGTAIAAALLLSACSPAATPTDAKVAQASQHGNSMPGRLNPPGSRVSLWLPNAMERPMRLLMFVNEGRTFSIAVGELTGATENDAQEAMEGVTGAADERNSSRAPAARGEAKGFLARSEADGVVVQALALRHGLAVAVIIVRHQPAEESLVTKILDSVRLDPSAELDPLLTHGIAIGALQGMQVWDVASHPILLREAGMKPPFPPTAAVLALMVVPYATPNPSDEELGTQLGQLLVSSKPDMKQAKPRELKVAGLPAVEIVAPGNRDGEDVAVYGFIARGKEAALAGVGHVGKQRAGEVVNKFAELVRSIRLDDSILGTLPAASQ